MVTLDEVLRLARQLSREDRAQLVALVRAELEEAGWWEAASSSAAARVWENSADDVYAQLGDPPHDVVS